MLSGLVVDNPHKHVILRACVWNALLKVNKDLRLLKPILICGSWSRLGSWRCLPIPAQHAPSERYRLWALLVENKRKYEQWISSLCCLVKKNNAEPKGLFKTCKILQQDRNVATNTPSRAFCLGMPRWTLQFPCLECKWSNANKVNFPVKPYLCVLPGKCCKKLPQKHFLFAIWPVLCTRLLSWLSRSVTSAREVGWQMSKFLFRAPHSFTLVLHPDGGRSLFWLGDDHLTQCGQLWQCGAPDRLISFGPRLSLLRL